MVAELALTTNDRIMDLGCGPGLLAVALAPFVKEVVAIDPAAEMLAVGRDAARDRPGKIQFVEGSSNDLGTQFGRFRLVAMGRSFHWMDRAETLKRLDTINEPDGAVALFDVDTVRQDAGDWHAPFDEIVERYAAGKAEWRAPDWVPHETFLLDSPFSPIDGASVVEWDSFPAAQLVDRAFSMSRTAPDALGPDKAEALAADLRALAADVAVDGMIGEILESRALIARRPNAN